VPNALPDDQGSILEGQGRGLMFDFDFHHVPQGWWGPRKWPKLRAKLLEHDPWLIQMLEHHQRLLIAQQRRITELEHEIANGQPPHAHSAGGSGLASQEMEPDLAKI
jgi:hypothetical protein